MDNNTTSIKNEKTIVVGYEKATYEKDGKKTEYNKYYIVLGEYKLTIKVNDQTAKEMLTRYLNK